MRVNYTKSVSKKAPETKQLGSLPYGQLFKTSEDSGLFMVVVGNGSSEGVAALNELAIVTVFDSDREVIPVEGSMTVEIEE